MKDELSFIWLQYYVQAKRYCGEGYILFLYLICFVYLMIANQKFRKKYGYGMLLLTCLICVPYLYMPLWHRLFGGITWRIFWMLCEAFVCCYAFVDLIGRIKNKVLSAIAVVLCLMVFVSAGQFVYLNEAFKAAENPHKLSQTIVDIADYLLSLEEHPKVLAQGRCVTQLRQYSTDIYMLYGRDTKGGSIPIADERMEQVRKKLKKSTLDIAFVTQVCQEYGVKYLVVNHKGNQDTFPAYGWRLIEKIGQYYIYLRD